MNLMKDATSYNKRVSGFGTLCLRPNPRFARTLDTRNPLTEIALSKEILESICRNIRKLPKEGGINADC